MPSGPGADEEEDFESAWVISSLVTGGAEFFGLSLGGGRRLLWEGKNSPVGPHSSAVGYQPRSG